VYDSDEEQQDPDERPAYDWDAWEKNRFTGLRRWYLLMLIVGAISMTILYFQSDGQVIPWGPPG
jgi:hypothetical protein